MTTPAGLGFGTPSRAADLSAGSTDGPAFLGLSQRTWAKAGLIAVLFAAVFWPNLRRLWLKTNPFTGEANWGHSIFVPIIGLYYLFVNREAILSAGGRSFVWGRLARPGRLGAAIALLAVGGSAMAAGQLESGMVRSLSVQSGQGLLVLGTLVLLLDWSLAATLFGLGLFVFGIWPGQNDYLKDLGMVVTLFGIVLMLCGPGVMRTAWFPIAFLVCALPWPGLVYSWVAEPLSQFAAYVAVTVLKLTGVDASTSGTKIVIYSGLSGIPPRILNVAEACAGMRSLMTFISVAAALAFLSARPLWQKLVMVASAVPIAIGCNVMRISGQGLLDHYVSPKWSESYAHQMVGLMMLVPAFLLILLVGWVLDQMFIEEADDDGLTADGRTAPAAAPTVVTRAAAVAKPAGAPAPVAKPAVVGQPATPPATAVAAKAAVVSAPPPAVVTRPTPPAPPRPATAAVPAVPRPAGVTPAVPPRPRTAANPLSTVPPLPARRPPGGPVVPPRGSPPPSTKPEQP